jgi:hypothetical protein
MIELIKGGVLLGIGFIAFTNKTTKAPRKETKPLFRKNEK